MSKVAVIAGAGPAGLTAAYELIKRTDIQPIVFEATDAIGGIAQTYNFKGNRIDIGGHRFFSKSDRVMRWWFNILPLQGAPAADTEEMKHEIDYASEVIVEYLCPECVPEADGKYRHTHEHCTVEKPAPDPRQEDLVMLQRPRKSRIYFNQNFFPYPIGITLTVAWRLGMLNTLLIGLSYIKAKVFPVRDEQYLDAFLTNRFGKRLYKTFFESYTEKVWGVPCSEIKADWGAQRIKGLSLKRALVHAVKDLLSSDFQKSQKERETSLITRFYYPKFGPGQMWEEVAKQVETCGGEVKMQHRVVGVQLDDSSKNVQSVTVENMVTKERTTVECDYFFSTMPIKHLMPMTSPTPPSSVCSVAEGLVYRDFITVGLLLNKLHVVGQQTAVPDNWIYVQDKGVQVGRIQIFNNWSPYMIADREQTVWIGLEYFVNEGDALWKMPDEELIQLGLAEVEQINFALRSDYIDGCVLRMPKTYPAYFGTYDQLDSVQEYVQGIENLFLIGRNGLHRYNNQDHSMLTAMMAVDNIIEGRTDDTNIWNVNAERVYHEEKEVAAPNAG